MTSMNVSLPNQMKDWVESKIHLGQYHNASEYVRALIRKDQLEVERALAFRSAIDMGRNSGVDERSFDQVIGGAKEKAKRT